MKKNFLKISLIAIVLLTGFKVFAQMPIGITKFGADPFIDYIDLHSTGINGDTSYFQAWASNSMLPLFLDPTGLPILGTENDYDMSSSGCTGSNVSIIQLSKLPPVGTTATAGNTLLNIQNCMASFGGGVGNQTGWTGETTIGSGNLGAGWKGAILAFRNNKLFAPFYRQNNQGTIFGDSTLNMSPDAGQNWIDYGHWSSYVVTNASWSANTVTLTVASTTGLVTGNKIYVHDIVPTGYNGKATITVVNGTTLTYTLYNNTTPWDTTTPASDPGAYTSGGAFGLLQTDGSAALGPGSGAGYKMMWPMTAVGGTNAMNWQIYINYGQDGSYPSGIEPGCDPASYLCGLAINMGYVGPMILFRVPVGQEMVKSAYQWYTCPGYVAKWPVQATVCDGNNNANWTSTLASATPLANGHKFYSITYSPQFKAYILASAEGYSYYWAPHPWGPFYLMESASCVGNAGIQCWSGFHSLLSYGSNVISASLPKIQYRISMNSGYTIAGRSAGGNPTFWSVETGPGRLPMGGGIARRADYFDTGQFGVGHRFTQGNESGSISTRGRATNGGSYVLQWWTDLWDHGGKIGYTNRPYFRDLVTGGTNYFDVKTSSGNGFAPGQGTSLLDSGLGLEDLSYSARAESNFNDTATVGNTSWTLVSVFNTRNRIGQFNRPVPIMTMGTGATGISMLIGKGGAGTDGNLCISWGGGIVAYSPNYMCTSTFPVLANTWYFVAMSAEATGTGYPIIRMYLASAGTMTEFGGTNMATSPNGATGGGLTKFCSSCAVAPTMSALPIELGYDGTQGESMTGIFGEASIYSGAVPSNVVRRIYKTLQTDWARVGRGAI